GPLLGSLSESPMPIRPGAMQRPRGCRCGNTLRHRYDEVGLPCSSTMGSPAPTSTYAISRPRTRLRCFWYGNAAEITFAAPVAAEARPAAALEAGADTMRCMTHSFQVGGAALDVNMRRAVQSLNCTRVVPALAKAGSSIRPCSGWLGTWGWGFRSIPWGKWGVGKAPRCKETSTCSATFCGRLPSDSPSTAAMAVRFQRSHHAAWPKRPIDARHEPQQ